MRGATWLSLGKNLMTALFQSTLPMRGATRLILQFWKHKGDFNPHSPCGERPSSSPFLSIAVDISIHTPHAGSDAAYRKKYYEENISIHTPHAGSDPYSCEQKQPLSIFQSTLPMRGATKARPICRAYAEISIHTPHAGSDQTIRVS